MDLNGSTLQIQAPDIVSKDILIQSIRQNKISFCFQGCLLNWLMNYSNFINQKVKNNHKQYENI